MPRSLLTEKEIELLFECCLASSGAEAVERLLASCHQFNAHGGSTPYERYFSKELAYKAFEVHIPYFTSINGNVTGMDIQFKRRSSFLSHFIHSRPLIRQLIGIIAGQLGRSPIVVKNHNDEVQFHFNPQSRKSLWSSASPFEVWKSECAIYDEPHSAGQAYEYYKYGENDFVIVRYRQKSA